MHNNNNNNNNNNNVNMMNTKIDKPLMNFASLCFLTSGVRVIDKEKIEPHESSVLCESVGSHSKSEYYFDHVINGKPEILNTYKKYISPLIEQTIAGKSCMLLANSIPKNDFSPYFLGDDSDKPSILISIVTQLLKHNNNNIVNNTKNNNKEKDNSGIVTFSWYKINCDKNETIIDVLKEASGPQNNNTTNKNKNNNNNNELLLREIGRGRGMTVSGLWEVELSSASDIEAIINHVLQVYTDADNITKSHSIFQFVYTPKNTIKSVSSPASKSIISGQQDTPGVGRFNFIVLSSLSGYDYNTIALGKIAHHPMTAFENDWMLKLKNIIDWINSGRPSPPFHKSRFILLLRDLLCGRQPCILLQCIDKFITNNGHQINTQKSEIVSMNDMLEIYHDNIHRWFQIMASIAYTRDSKLVVGNPFIYDNNNNDNNNNNNSDNNNKKHEIKNTVNNIMKPPLPPHDTNIKKNIKTPNSMNVITTTTTNNNNNKTINIEKRSTSRERERIPTPTIENNNNNINNDTDILKDNLKKKLNTNITNDIIPSWTNSSPNPPPPPPLSNKTIIDIIPIDSEFHPVVENNNRIEEELNNEISSNIISSKVTRRKSTIMEISSNKTHIDDHYRNTISDTDKHAMMLLSKALEDSKKEVQLLSIELEETNNKFEACRTAYDLLVETIKQEGSMLKQKDRENYHKALRDLNDYSIYKEVVEAAMVRLQNELDTVLLENKKLKEESEKNLKNMRKKLNTSQKYDHYATNVYKKYSEAENSINILENDKKKLIKEKDQLQDLLTHCKIQLQDMKDKYENEENQLNYNNLLYKINEYENNPNFKKVFGNNTININKNKKLTTSINNLNTNVNDNNDTTTSELNLLKQAHSKALEKIMTLQEENDEMRQALIELVPEDQELVDIAKSTLKV